MTRRDDPNRTEDRRGRHDRALAIARHLAQAGEKVTEVTEMERLPGHRPGDASSFKVTISGQQGTQNYLIPRVE
jgi:hypothetical protein